MLKASWQRLLNVTRLPSDHYAVFRSVTSDSVVPWPEIRRALGERHRRSAGSDGAAVCDIQTFRKLIAPLARPRHQEIWAIKGKPRPPGTGPLGIPQGSAISASLANLYMFDTDLGLVNTLGELGATYRRYSDDILVVGPPGTSALLEQIVADTLASVGLSVAKSKTERAMFRDGRAVEPGPSTKGRLSYLGLTFDGSSVRIRESSIARYSVRMVRAVERAKTAASEGDGTLRRRKLFATMSRLGPGKAYGPWIAEEGGKTWPASAPRLGFHGYADRVRRLASSEEVGKQQARAWSRLHWLIARARLELSEE